MKKPLEKKSRKQTEKLTEQETPKIDLWTFVNSINKNKKYIYNEETKSEYDPWKINKAFSLYHDTVPYANEMNRYYFLDKKLQYDYLINSIRSQNRYAKWVKKDKDSQFNKDLEAVKEFYGYGDSKARTALSLLSNKQIATIKEKLEKGGVAK